MTYAEFIRNRLRGQEVHIVASGPSLKDFDYSTLDGKNIIAVNHSYIKVKNPLWCVAMDVKFILSEDPRAPYNVQIIGPKMRQFPQIIHIRKAESLTEFSMDPTRPLYCRKDSGCTAITTALHAGAEKIYLYGFDCQISEGDNLLHATDQEFNHRQKLSYLNPNDIEKLKENLKAKIKLFSVFPSEKIINMNPKSAIPYFRGPE